MSLPTNTVASLIPMIRGLVKDQNKNDGRDAYDYLGDDKFTLSESFVDADSIVAYQNGNVIDSANYSYNEDTNQVEFDFVSSGEGFVTNDTVMITYGYYKKYSDTEITGYLSSSFPYFQMHRYNKVFVIDSNENIQTLNGIKPSIKELYFMCIIAAILIDPQNIEINTPEFRLTANRKDSDQEQIAKAFAHFRKFVGSLEFEPDFFQRNNRLY